MATATGSGIKDKYDKWIKDSLNMLVITSNNPNIKDLSDSTGGVYLDYNKNTVSEISSWLDTREKVLSSEDILTYKELFYYPIFLALMFFILGVTNLYKKFFKVLAMFLLLVGVSLQADMREFSTESAGDTAFATKKSLEELEVAKLFEGKSPEHHYNLANAYYKAGMYEKAIDIYKEIRSKDANLKAKIYHNLGNSYVRLEMYEEAKKAYTKSLIVEYDKETDENLRYITNFKKAEGLQTGQQEGKKKNEAKQVQASKKDGKKKKGAGSSNMKVSAQAGAGSKSKGKKSKAAAQVNFNKSQSALSYKQYELINERKTNEENPW
jgi:Ca-activated chloride channel family protein